jgi:hypothetical protein
MVERIGHFFVGEGGTPDVGRLVLGPHAPGVLPPKSSQRLGSSHGPSSLLVGPLCYEKLTVARQIVRYAPVGEIHTTKGETATFTYGKTADSIVGVGVGPALNGPFSLSGEGHVANSLSNQATWRRQSNFSRRLRSKFLIQIIKHQPTGACASTKAFYTAQAARWIGGTYNGKHADDPTHGCTGRYGAPSRTVELQPGDSMEFGSGKAFEYKFGASLPGIDLTIQSGYSTNVKIAFFAKTRHVVLCGDTGPPGQAARIFSGN